MHGSYIKSPKFSNIGTKYLSRELWGLFGNYLNCGCLKQIDVDFEQNFNMILANVGYMCSILLK